MVAQGSRRCIFSIDTVDESRNQSKGAQVQVNIQLNDDSFAQGSRRGTLSIDTVDESKNRLQNLQVYGNLQTNAFSTAKILPISTPVMRLIKVTYCGVSIFRRVGKVEDASWVLNKNARDHYNVG